MQIVPRYLVKNKTHIVANEAGLVTEYRPVYQKHIQVYKGIDNVLEFKLLNADQKPIDLNIKGYTPKFQAFDENKKLIIEHDGTVVQGDDSAATRGLFTVTISDNDLLNVKQQYLSYNIHLVDSNGDPVITYTDTHFGNNGVIYVSGEAFPGPSNTRELTFTTANEENNEFILDGTVDAQPGINGNEALHTMAVYPDNFVGDLTVQATLDNQPTNQTEWADITTVSFTGNETQPKPINFNGVYSYLRFKTSVIPTSNFKILVRN